MRYPKPLAASSLERVQAGGRRYPDYQSGSSSRKGEIIRSLEDGNVERNEQKRHESWEKPSVPRISVVIPTYRRPTYLARCLGGLFRQSFPASHLEVVVVDDGSREDTAPVVSAMQREAPFPVHFATQMNQGPGAARNRGAQLAAGDFFLFLGDDVVPDPELVAEHLAGHAALATPGTVLGREERPRSNAISPFGVYMAQVQADYLAPIVSRAPGTCIPFRFCCTANLSIHRDAFLKVGSFDESFRILEDTDLGYRLEQAGFPLIYWPAAKAQHFHPIYFTAQCDLRVRTGYYMVRFKEKHGCAPRCYERRPRWKRWLGGLVYPQLVWMTARADPRGWPLPRPLYQRLLEHYEQFGAEMRWAERSS